MNNILSKITAAISASLIIFSGVASNLAYAEKDPLKVGHNRRVRAYKLESVLLNGTDRMTTEEITYELGLVKGVPLDDELVMTTRSRLLSLGLFKSVILIMRKGSKAGFARLIIEVEDDDGVLTDWALGGDLGVTMSEDNATANANETDQAPLDYHLGLVGRNIGTSLHRMSMNLDINNEGNFREGQIAYGLPRFALEDAQFDAEIAAINVTHRYLSALGFGARGQGLWSHSVDAIGEIQYGAAMYVNQTPNSALPGFPTSVAGPKFAYRKESRLRGFFPGSGSMMGASLLFAPMQTENSVLEVNLAKTWGTKRFAFFTLDANALTVGINGYSFRGEGRLDVPLGIARINEDQSELFLRLRGGSDAINDTNLVGSAAILGLRYHSSGFIAEFAIKITRSPEEIIDDTTGGVE
jgi:hypothetical protein